MYKVISFEDACNLKNITSSKIDVKNDSLFIEANNDSRCKFVLDYDDEPQPHLSIFVKDESIHHLLPGCIIVPIYDQVFIYAAFNIKGDIARGEEICKTDRNASIRDIISKCKEEINICPFCRRVTPYEIQETTVSGERGCGPCVSGIDEELAMRVNPI